MVRISNYGGGSSPSSRIKAMKVEIGKYTLYFSYNTLIGFKDENHIFVSEDYYSITTSGHKYQIGGRYDYAKKQYISEKLLNVIAQSNLLKLPLEACGELVDRL